MNSSTPSLFFADCPTRLATEILGDKWTASVIHALSLAPRRHGELEAAIGGISRKVLTDTLRRLQRYGLVEQRQHPSRHLEYRLSELGRTLVGPVESLTAWARAYGGAVAAFQEEHDTRNGS